MSQRSRLQYVQTCIGVRCTYFLFEPGLLVSDIVQSPLYNATFTSQFEPQYFIGHCLPIPSITRWSRHSSSRQLPCNLSLSRNEAEQDDNGSGIPIQIVSGLPYYTGNWTFGEWREELLRNPGVRGTDECGDRWPMKGRLQRKPDLDDDAFCCRVSRVGRRDGNSRLRRLIGLYTYCK